MRSIYRPRHARIFACLMLSFGFAPSFVAVAAPADPLVAAADDPDFKVQGEYTGDDRSMQVIAIGDGEFEIVVFEAPIDERFSALEAPRKLDGDADTVAELADSLSLRRVERKSPTLGAKPPSNAVVLFDGTEASLSNWKGGGIDDDGFLKQGTQTTGVFADYRLHLEFRTPWMPTKSGQARGNSGVYHQGRYETQVLDSFGLEGASNETGGIYQIKAPDFNACLPPMQWQTYDVDFTAARFEGDNKVADARMTVRVNGIVVQNDVVVNSATGGAILGENAQPGPIYLQDHGDPVRFRNIWLVERDPIREANRPIVPGFERFFTGGAPDPNALGGELLIEALACTACHDGATSVLPTKRGPDLSDVASRIRPDALVAMIQNPHQTKRGTSMPDPWPNADEQTRKKNAAALASFLLTESNGKSWIDRPSRRSQIAAGEVLYHSVGCVACHQAFDGRQAAANTTVPLGDIATKYTVDGLAGFLQNPHHIRSGGRMPALAGSKADAYSIAAYLTRDVTRRRMQTELKRSFYRGSWDRLPDFSKLEPESVTTINRWDRPNFLSENNIGVVYEAEIEILADNTYEFLLTSDDGSRLVIDGQEIVNDGIHPATTKSGRFKLNAGIHPVRIEFFNGGGGGELEVHVNDPLLGRVRLDEMLASGETAPRSLVKDHFAVDEALIESGRELFQSAGCASCHKLNAIASSMAKAPAFSKANLDAGCLASEIQSPAVDYSLSDRQRDAIVGAIKRQQATATESIADHDAIHLSMAAMNCYACHVRDGKGGPEPSRDTAFQTTTVEMGWESRMPPPLDGVGDKLKSEYLHSTIENGANERPYMLTRMPGFGKDTLDQLADRFVKLDANAEGALAVSEIEETVYDGRTLVGATGLSCIKCHAYGGVKGGGIGVIDLVSMPKRLRSEWFHRYLMDPVKYRPGTRMPNSFPEGRSTFTKLYHGDADEQITAIWSYLSAGKSAQEPLGLRAGSILLSAGERPLIYRNFFEGVSGRGIAVGYPEGVNLIWDAERFGLNEIWRGDYIDASRHWTGRGQGRTNPVGSGVTALETATPIAIGDAVQMDWPSGDGRELGYRFKGYRLDKDGRPVFRYQIGDAIVEDYLQPVTDSSAIRTLSIQWNEGATPKSLVWRPVTTGDVKQTEQGFESGSVKIQLDLPAHVINEGGRNELRVLLPAQPNVSVTEVISW
ncbi:family 16 glycoside hydrolase [Rhodopirellula sp. MGV]|uniref:family 16 glycoside hydrolase n=1 Tax=Rhodopirellula sp. MGV TaxID=2023130 RepID=UPI000B978DEC|nr:family 16 glycoside hydrolase [Rhodopirellula sp. MGV]OYP28214.1 hypothetical protein CGZ80_27380 [Rhodopirellula sp. MGV]PNY34390.1 DUF1080 domain-containing protein [Rhodopirellula baltica]